MLGHCRYPYPLHHGCGRYWHRRHADVDGVIWTLRRIPESAIAHDKHDPLRVELVGVDVPLRERRLRSEHDDVLDADH